MLFPSGEQAADGEEGGARHLREIFTGELDLDGAIDFLADLGEQANELPSNALGNLLGGDFTETGFQSGQAAFHDVQSVATKSWIFHQQAFEGGAIPNNNATGGQSFGGGGVSRLFGMANAADDFTRADETKDNGTSSFAEQSDLHAAFGEKENFLDGIAGEEHGLATGNFDGTSKGQNFGVVSLRDVHKQLG